MKLVATSLEGVVILEPRIFSDERGFFLETYNLAKLTGSALETPFSQDNHSRSTAGVIRGLHYQLRNPQGKLVHVARGAILDVAVDIRVGSPSFGKWTAVELNDENLRSLWIPPGFAHGFCVLSPVADVMYKCTTVYDPSDDHGVAWNDRTIGIEWPVAAPVVSSKDMTWTGLTEDREDLPRYA
jgi:dTDP-4-dehydrorhamnose 3,5-epimerase